MEEILSAQSPQQLTENILNEIIRIRHEETILRKDLLTEHSIQLPLQISQLIAQQRNLLLALPNLQDLHKNQIAETLCKEALIYLHFFHNKEVARRLFMCGLSWELLVSHPNEKTFLNFRDICFLLKFFYAEETPIRQFFETFECIFSGEINYRFIRYPERALNNLEVLLPMLRIPGDSLVYAQIFNALYAAFLNHYEKKQFPNLILQIYLIMWPECLTSLLNMHDLRFQPNYTKLENPWLPPDSPIRATQSRTMRPTPSPLSHEEPTITRHLNNQIPR